jgi:hypothetical protein
MSLGQEGRGEDVVHVSHKDWVTRWGRLLKGVDDIQCLSMTKACAASDVGTITFILTIALFRVWCRSPVYSLQFLILDFVFGKVSLK